MKLCNRTLSLISINTLLLATLSLSTYATEFYNFIGIDITKPERTLSQDNVSFKQNYGAKLNFGFGKVFQLNENWQLAPEISLNYLNTSINSIHIGQVHGSVDYQELGLTTSLKLKRINIFEDFAPFIEISTGIINSRYQHKSSHVKNSDVGFKATTGVDFNLSEGSTFSVGVGYSSFNDFNIEPK